MGKKIIYFLCVYLMMISFICPDAAFTEITPQVKVSVFNFGTVTLEASGYNTTVTNMVINTLGCERAIALLDRKELESFLSLNDLQQDDNIENAINIGSRLGLNVIVVGSVGKRGSIIVVNCKVINIEQRRVILDTHVRSFGDAGLMAEIGNLSRSIVTAISSYTLKQKDMEKTSTQGPVNVQKRSGNKKIYLSWEDPQGVTASGYEIFRSTSESGPFAKVSQVNQPEFIDQELERSTTYYYKVRAYNNRGIQSDFSAIIPAETSLTPNPPVIFRADGHIKNIELTWSPSPIPSEDPLKLKGYKLYRAKTAQGPFLEVANILGKDLGIGVDTATTLDKIFKVTYTDKGLKDGEDYYYKLTAYNERNLESDFSTCMKGNTIPAVSSFTVQGDMIREITLTWSSLDSPFIKAYSIYRSTSESGNFVKIKKIDAPDPASGKYLYYTDKEGLADKTRYYYRITASEDSDGETMPSVTVSALTKGKPPTPQGLKAQNGLVKKVEVTWTASPQEEVEGYNLYWSKEKVGKYMLLKRIEGRATNSFSHDGGGFEKLEDNATYFYTISAFNKVDVESDLSNAVFAKTKPRPAKPAGLKGMALKVKEAPITWLPNAEKDIAAYHIYRSPGSEEDYSRIVKVQGKTRYEDKELKDGHAYRYKIQAEDRDELLSDFSDSIVVQTKPKPKAPGRLKGDILQGRVELTWQPGNEHDISQYTVYEKRYFGLEKINTVKTTNFSEAGLEKGKSKTYVVTSVDKDNLESDPSEEITITGK